jgi:hypothetical protein
MYGYFFETAPSTPVISPSISFQTLGVIALRVMHKTGADAIGLDPSFGSLFHALCYASWMDARDDGAVKKAASEYISKAVEMAKELGAETVYIFIPFSSHHQRFIEAYGKNNVKEIGEGG